MWENILKRSGKKSLDFQFLKEITLDKVRGMKGQVLTRDEYLKFQEEIRKIYRTRHQAVRLSQVEFTITKILKSNNLLEVNRKEETKYDSEGKKFP